MISCDANSLTSDMMRTGSAESILANRSPVHCKYPISCYYGDVIICRQGSSGTPAWPSKVQQFREFANHSSC